MTTTLAPLDQLTLCHFNDVYHINDHQRLARFAYALRRLKSGHKLGSDRPITVFSGDTFSPSLESSVLKEEHIVPILNHLLIDLACYGNHDFDFGEDTLSRLSAQTNFPWLLSNAVHKDGTLLAEAKEYVVRDHRGYKIGFFGLAGTDWPSNCQHLPSDSKILDPVGTATRISQFLREELHVDLVIAITHMRLDEDKMVSHGCSGVDLILGGHDHDIVVYGHGVTVLDDNAMGDIKIIKSGTDFRSYSIISLNVTKQNGQTLIKKVQLNQVQNISLQHNHPEDPDMCNILRAVQARITTIVDKRLLYTNIPLDGRSAIIRTAETNLGSLLADAVRAYYNTNIAFINSGSVRCDRIIPAGEMTVKDVIDIVPFDNPFVVKRLSGHTLLHSLENSVSDARTDGRFLQLSGLAIVTDFRLPEGSRILSATVISNNRAASDPHKGPIRTDTFYTVAMASFIADGFDGYTLFQTEPTIVNVESATTDTSLMLKIFRGNSHNNDIGRNKDETDIAIDRARAIVLVGSNDGLPVIQPQVQGRISTTGHSFV